ncbi:2-hydroxyacylsphingosine 1-beta-galactosyltransferase [Drosophila erecta]|uniref:GG12425 n=1 Tax=Drosophila erecta TaxID=7220 RepID=B3P7B1_DROER|nr:2-hydroxyacylsphingosine 1-beta-galactosyltransferase [Drosophila erecta]
MCLGYLWLTICLCLLLQQDLRQDLAQAAHILGIFPYRHISPYLVMQPLVRTLAKRGHNVTLITPNEMPNDIEGIRHIRVAQLNECIKEMLEFDQVLDFMINKWTESALTAKALFNASHDILSDPGVQRMLHDRNERFDLIIMEPANLDALYGLVEYYNASLIGLSSIRINWHTDELAGNPAPSIYEPISPVGYSLETSLLSRIYNWIHIMEEKLVEYLILRPAQLHLFQKFFGYSAQKMSELRSRFSLMLINSHYSMGKVRANAPNIIEVGGLHLSEPPELCDAKLLKFLDEAEQGVIYFSLGNDILIKFLPANIQELLLQTFAKLKQRVIWKNELLDMPNKSVNVYVMEQTPQRQILNHPNVRLFITNGGLLSVIEAVDSGVPMLGLPMFFDQFGNMRWGQLSGMAEVIDINSLNEDILTETIKYMLGNQSYSLKAKEMSQFFKDRPMNPLDTAVWWTEYALRNRNITRMRLNLEEVPLLEYYRIDSILAFSLRFGLVAVALIFLVYTLFLKNRQT